MVFRIKANLNFATAGDRTAGITTINNAISGRNTVVIRNLSHTRLGVLSYSWEGEEQDTGDAGTIYALIQAMTTPLPGSKVAHHTCFHGDSQTTCLLTASKEW